MNILKLVIRPLARGNCGILPLRHVRSSTSSATINNSPHSTDDVKPFSQVPGPTGIMSHPIIGSVIFMITMKMNPKTSFDSIYSKLRQDYGDIVKLRSLGSSEYMVILFHPDDAKTLLQTPETEYRRFTFEISEAMFTRRKEMTRSLVALKGKEWADRRKPAQEKMLRPAVVASYVPLIEKVTNDFVEKWKKQPEINDLLEEMTNYALESVGMLCFNKRLGCLNAGSTHPTASNVREILEMLSEGAISPFKTYKHFKTKFYKRFERATLAFYNVARAEIESQRSFLTNLEKEGKLEEYLEKEPNFMYSLISDPRVKPEEANSLVSDLFFAGIDTTANTITFVLTDLALNQEKQQKLYDEIQRVLGDSATLTKEHLAEMSYLKACLRESHRLNFPLLTGVARWLETDLVLGGYKIPKDTMVNINSRAMSIDERFYPKPKEYIPERWLRDTKGELAKNKDVSFATMPFGFGPRSCIGQRFAEIEIYIGVAKIIQNFHVSLPGGVTEIKSATKFFRSPIEKVTLQLKDREKI